MAEYHVSLPQGLLLTVDIEDDPVTMHITFPQGKKVTFHYAGKPTRRATITQSQDKPPGPIPATHPRKDPKEMAKHGPLKKTFAEEALAAGISPAAKSANLRIEYVDPQGSEM